MRRGARVVVAAPFEGPLRDATAGRATVLAPRLRSRRIRPAAISRQGLAAFGAVDPALRTDLGALADELDAEALRNGAVRRCSPTRRRRWPSGIAGRQTVLAGDAPRSWPGPRWGGPAAIGGRPVCGDGPGRRAGCSARAAWDRFADPVDDALFHDEELDGPRPAVPSSPWHWLRNGWP